MEIPFLDMIRDMDYLYLFEIGHHLSANIISHRKLKMVQEGHRRLVKVIISRFVELNIPFCGTPYESVLKQSQLN
jgi:hypothetical protein